MRYLNLAGLLKLPKLQLLLFMALFGFMDKGLGKTRVNVEFVGPVSSQLVEVDMPVGNDFSFNNPTYYTVTNGKLSFEVNVSRTTLLQIKTSYKRIFLVVNPTGDINIKIQKTFDKYKALTFEGPNAEGQRWYNIYNDQPLANRINPTILFGAITASSKNAGLKKLGEFIGGQTRPLNILYQQKKIDKQFYTLIKAELRAMHAQYIVERLRNLQEKISDKKTIQNYQVFVDAVMAFAGPNNVDNARSMFGQTYLTDYYTSLARRDGKETSPEWGPYYSYTFAPDSIKMRLLGNILVFAKTVGTNEFDYNTGYGLYKREFPHSAYIQFLDTVNAKKEELTSGNIKLDTAAKYQTFKGLLQHYKGQAVYIDLWASWCMPCRGEFPYYQKLRPLLKKKNVKSVFVSIDRPEAKKVWKMLIKFNQLEGDHILVTRALMKDMVANIYKSGEVTIPRYILVNKGGKVISWDAPRPSDSNLITMLGKM